MVLIVTLALVGLGIVVLRAARGRPGGEGQMPNPFRTRNYQLAVLAEIIAIPLAGGLLTAAGRPDAVMLAVAAIVGLHFFGLIRAFRSWRFAVVGIAMVLVALLGLALAPAVPVAAEPTAVRSERGPIAGRAVCRGAHFAPPVDLETARTTI